ncbi:MAG TPA: hypothetical protein V6C81_18310 [Planktothrix sp.]|jgi:hypothetical protein
MELTHSHFLDDVVRTVEDNKLASAAIALTGSAALLYLTRGRSLGAVEEAATAGERLGAETLGTVALEHGSQLTEATANTANLSEKIFGAENHLGSTLTLGEAVNPEASTALTHLESADPTAVAAGGGSKVGKFLKLGALGAGGLGLAMELTGCKKPDQNCAQQDQQGNCADTTGHTTYPIHPYYQSGGWWYRNFGSGSGSYDDDDSYGSHGGSAVG